MLGETHVVRLNVINSSRHEFRGPTSLALHVTYDKFIEINNCQNRSKQYILEYNTYNINTSILTALRDIHT